MAITASVGPSRRQRSVRSRSSLATILVFSTWSLSASGAQAPDPSPDQAAIRAALQARFERVDEFQLSEGPAGAQGRFFILGDLTPKGQRPNVQVRVDPAAAASAALALSANLLQIDLNEFTPRLRSDSTDEQGVIHRRYDFIFMGWRVEDFELATHIQDDGTLTAINGNVVRFLPTQIAQLRARAGQIGISSAQAQATVVRALEGALDGTPRIEQIVLSEAPYFFWTVAVGTRNPLAAWRYYVNAQSGTILKRVDLMIR